MNAALVLIDIQKGFNDPFWGSRNNPGLEYNVERLLDQWRATKRPIFHVQHLSEELNSPLRPDRPGVEFMEFARPKGQEPVFRKSVHSAFIKTSLEAELRCQKIAHLVLVGFTSDHCVSTTTRMGFDLGFKITIAFDGVATFDRVGHDGARFSANEVQAISLASLHMEFANILSTEELCR
ncbi:MAG: cysteine hydrolase family protein [Pseudomonadota bacterium]